MLPVPTNEEINRNLKLSYEKMNKQVNEFHNETMRQIEALEQSRIELRNLVREKEAEFKRLGIDIHELGF